MHGGVQQRNIVLNLAAAGWAVTVGNSIALSATGSLSVAAKSVFLTTKPVLLVANFIFATVDLVLLVAGSLAFAVETISISTLCCVDVFLE
jgi:hypothetical protein